MKTYIVIGLVIGILAIGSVATFILFNPSNVADESDNNEIEFDPNTIFKESSAYKKTINSFAFELLNKFRSDEQANRNIFFSPYSIFTALAMSYEGARGNTASEMANVLEIEQDNASFHNYVSSFYDHFNLQDKYTISTANALWIKENFGLLEEYINTVTTYYHAESSEIDFSNPDIAAEIINNWVENKTNNLIKDLVSPDVIDPDLCRLILTNAIYFKGTWQIQFDEDNTTDRDFTTTAGDVKKVPTMMLSNTQDRFNYTETASLQLLELPYAGNDLSMIIGLPKPGNNITSIIDSINEETYDTWLESMKPEEVDIYLPKFKIETPVLNLNKKLQDLGIKDAFTYDADFSGITGRSDLMISDVIHKAFIEVNEEGTEAAAATAVIMVLKSSNGNENERILFNCDHSFFHLIQHKASGTILFLGTIDDPLQ